MTTTGLRFVHDNNSSCFICLPLVPQRAPRMKGFLSLVCLLALMSNCESDIIVRQREINGRIKTYYKLTGVVYDFKSALNWCHGLGGQLPIILTEKELDFLADMVIVKNDMAGTEGFTYISGYASTWMGLKKENGHCFNWLDGTRVNMSFSYESTCESCPYPCCAMFIWNNYQNHKRMGFADCSLLGKAVCVFDEEKAVVLPKDPAYLTKLYGELNGSLNNLSQNTENNFDHIKLNISELQSLAMKEHIETKKILDETHRQLNETETNLDQVKLHVNEFQNFTMKQQNESRKILDETRHKYGQLNDSILVLSEKTQKKIQSITEEQHETRRQMNQNEKQVKKIQTWVKDNVNIKSDTMKKIDSLAQKTENNLDDVKLDVNKFQSLATKEHNESKKILDETRHQLNETENHLKELQSLSMKEQYETKKMLDETRLQLNETENQLKNLQTWVNNRVNIKPDTQKEIDSLKKSSSTSNILHWTSLGMIGCLAVILGVIGYRTRRNSLPVTRQTSVAYVAGEETLNFSSAGSNSAPSNANFKTNNLYQAERNYCGAP